MNTTEILFGNPGPWKVDPETLVRLRLERAESELREGRLGSALVEAEELLSNHPDHRAALRVVATAALRMGNATLAEEVYAQLLERTPDDPTLLAGMAVALFGLSHLVESERLARKALDLDEENAQSWYCLALVLERTDRLEEADQAFRIAHAMDSRLYPLRRKLDQVLLEQALSEARASLEPVAQRFYGDVRISWNEFPSSTDLRATTPPLSPFVEALYEGTPPASGDSWSKLPSAVRLYSGNLAWGETQLEALVDRIQIALTREAHHWLGLPPGVNDSL